MYIWQIVWFNVVIWSKVIEMAFNSSVNSHTHMYMLLGTATAIPKLFKATNTLFPQPGHDSYKVYIYIFFFSFWFSYNWMKSNQVIAAFCWFQCVVRAALSWSIHFPEVSKIHGGYFHTCFGWYHRNKAQFCGHAYTDRLVKVVQSVPWL